MRTLHLVGILCCAGSVSTTGCQGEDESGTQIGKASLITACIRSTACGTKSYPSVHNCVNYYKDVLLDLGLAPVYDPIYRCINRAQSCKDVTACFGEQGECSKSFRASCADGRAVSCDLIDNRVYVLECAKAGLACEVDADHGFAAGCKGRGDRPSTLVMSSDCSDGSCERTNELCTGDELNRCAGDNILACLEGEWIGYHCDRLGLGPCREEDGGWARCSAK